MLCWDEPIFDNDAVNTNYVRIGVAVAVPLGIAIWLLLRPGAAPPASPPAAAPAADVALQAPSPAGPPMRSADTPPHAERSEQDPLNLTCTNPDGSPADNASVLAMAARFMRLQARRSIAPARDAPAARWLTSALHVAPEKIEERARRLGIALERDPNYTLALWHAFVMCHDQPNLALCERHDPGGRLAQLDSDNSEYWALTAVQRERAGDANGVLDALQMAASATRTSAYFPETVRLLFEAEPEGAAALRWIDAISTAITAPTASFGEILSVCRDSPRSEERRQACLQYGTRMHQQGRTMMQQSLGLGLQQTLLAAADDAQALERIVAQRAEISATARNAPIGAQAFYAEEYFGQPHFDAYIANLATHGEAYAMRRMQEDVRAYEQKVRAGEIEHPCPQLRTGAVGAR